MRCCSIVRCSPRWRWLTLAGLLTLLLAAIAKPGWQLWQMGRAVPSAPSGMVQVPAGWFIMGSDAPDADAWERPARKVFLPAFYLDRDEVTNRQFAAVFPDHHYPPEAADLPVTKVYRHQAEAYCRAVGKRLPTSAEWEKAARGTDGRLYPWGDVITLEHANWRLPGHERAGKLPPGSFPLGVSPYGCQDMAGNVWEWVSDTLDDSWWARWHGAAAKGILRGGAHGYGPWQARSSYLGFEGLDTTCNDVGFRAAQSVGR
jgi:formylglycine-generating enzyme required for sulfatase activity